MSIEDIIVHISIYIALIPIIIGIIRYAQLTTIQKLILWMVVLIFTNQIIGITLKLSSEITNDMPLYRLYMLIEFVFLGCIFYQLIHKKSFRRIIKSGSALFILWWSVEYTSSQIWNYPEFMRFSQGFIILMYSGVYFLQVFRAGRIENLLKETGFWVSVGLILYFASNSLLFLFSEFVVTLSDPSYYLIWTVHAFLTILLYIAYTIAIQCKTNHNLS